MTTYLCTLGLVLLSFKLNFFNKRKKNRFAVCVFCCALLIIVAGFRYFVGTDYGNYLYDYQQITQNGFRLSFLSQPALPLLALFCNRLGFGYELWFFLLSCITIIPVFLVIYRIDTPVYFPIVFFLFLGCWHQSFNLVRQTAAASIIFYGYFFLKDKRFFKWALCCVVASFFHITAILMIPIYFFATRKTSPLLVFVMCSFGIIFLFSYEHLFSLAEMLKQGVAVVRSGSATKENSVNILRVLVQCCPLLLYLFVKESSDVKNKENPVLLNMSLINAVLSICSMGSIYLFRFCLYTNIFNVLFISKLMEALKKRNKVVLVVVVVLYLSFWIYDLYKDPATNVYRWIFGK